MRARFTFISLLLLVVLAVGYFLSYMAGFLVIEPVTHSSWLPHGSASSPFARQSTAAMRDNDAEGRSPRMVIIQDSAPTAHGNHVTTRLASN